MEFYRLASQVRLNCLQQKVHDYRCHAAAIDYGGVRLHALAMLLIPFSLVLFSPGRYLLP